MPTGENFAANGDVQAAVWPQRAKFLANDVAAARHGGPSRCAAGAGVPGEAAAENAAAAPRGAARCARGDSGRRRPALGGPGRRARDGGKSYKDRGRARGDPPGRGIDPAGGRRCLPRAGGRPGRLTGAGEAEIAHRQGLPEFAASRGWRRLRRQPDAGSPGAPPAGFSAKKYRGDRGKRPRRIGDAGEQAAWFSYSARTMPIEKAYTEAQPARTVETKLKKGDLRKQAEKSAARFAKLPKWKQERLLAQLAHAINPNE